MKGEAACNFSLFLVCMAIPPFPDAIVICSIVLSAGTYLFDFGSNLVVLVEYSTRFMSLSRREQQGFSVCDADCRHQTSELAGYFYGLLAILACCHSLNAVLFKLKFTHRDAPLFAAYFLPLIHLYRLLHLLWRTLSCKGVRDLRSSEMNGLYSILGSSMEGVPMLILQFCGYMVLTRDNIFLHSMSTTFKVSVAASLISAAYNGGTLVQSIAKNAITLKQKIGAGAMGAGFTLSAAVSRCLTFTNVIVHIREYFSQGRTVREQAKFHVSDSIPLLVIAGSVLTYSLHFWLLHAPKDISKSLRDPHRLLTALVFSYMSTILGPIYPMISQANENNQLGCRIFRVKLCTVSVIHLLLDITVLCVTQILGTLPMPYLIVSVLAAVGYLAFLIGYIKFDAYCGPETRSNVSIIMSGHLEGGDDGNGNNSDGHKLDHSSEIHTLGAHAQPCADNSALRNSEHVTVTVACPLDGPSFPPELMPDNMKDSRHLILSASCSLGRERYVIKRDKCSAIAAWSSLDSRHVPAMSWHELDV